MENLIKTKICCKCGKKLDISMFGKAKTNKDGYKGTCKDCRKIYMIKYFIDNKGKIAKQRTKHYFDNIEHYTEVNREYTKNNKEKISINKRIYGEKNKKQLSIKHRKHYADNRTELLEQKQRYYLKNREQIMIKIKKYNKDNPELGNKINQKQKARKLLLPNTLTIIQWEIIKNDFSNRCAYCGKEKPLAQEHFLALSKDGEYTTNNIIPSCRNCNSSKKDKDFFIWYPKFRHYNKKREKFVLTYLHYKNNNQQLAFA